MKKVLLLFVLALCFIGDSFAQDKKVKVTGNVTDFEPPATAGWRNAGG